MQPKKEEIFLPALGKKNSQTEYLKVYFLIAHFTGKDRKRSTFLGKYTYLVFVLVVNN